MHPFCLPFGFCHDATSSSVATELVNPVHNSSSTSHDSTTATSTSGNNNNNSDDAIRNDRFRSKTSSPSDELFRQLNNASSSVTSHSLLNDDLIIGSSSSLNHLTEADETFYSLGLDIDADSHEIETDITFMAADEDPTNDDDLKVTREQDDWFCISSQYSPSPFSSPTSAHLASRRKSLIRTAILNGTHPNNQVFQNVVDPIDIKSSPTLAQLNLNSNDDPNDNFWDTATTTSATNIDLLSNCTSINGDGVSNNNIILNGTNNNNVTCNHLHHHHHAHHTHHHHHLPTFSTHPDVSSTLSCHHVHHHHHHQQQSIKYSSTTQSTCLAVSPFRKTDLQQRYSTCCHNLLTTTGSTSSNDASNISATTSNTCLHSSRSNLKPSATLNQLNQLGSSTNNNPQSASSIRCQLNPIDKHNQQKSSMLNNQQRSASPALVTSSSSPLSLNLSATANENRLIDNKLKENIEYLTALLCNGNKLDSCQNNTQQSIISSTMARSYSTLAHSLSTGPKLLERQQPLPCDLNAAQPQKSPYQAHQNHQQQNIARNPTNEALTCADGIHHHQQQHQQLQQLHNIPPQAIKRPYSEQWFKLPVESSVSAADSTESQISSLPNSERAPYSCQVDPSANKQVQDNSASLPGHKGTEMKVLSSLLNANKCTTPESTGHPNGCANWQDRANSCNPTQAQPLNADSAQSQAPVSSISTLQPTKQDSISPPKGKPITLTPISNQNGMIAQQKQRSRPTLFAQPASPSASSTASSVGNTTDIASTSSSVKRQRSSQPQSSDGKGDSSRSARPNSLSTDCSLSSHDEGFSSQIDNDDGGSTRESDDDDDVDSDDESFYGDYTNSDLIGASISDNAENKWTLNMGRTRRNGQKRYFWQYNVQSKGPKGTRICSTDDSEDPFVLPEASDPVFSNDCQVEGVKHSGKARRGDGNDLTPNPRKLLMIGLELKKLGKIINDLAPVTDLPVNARNKTRKEKNKLASRACRLKKKAQHEANKIKLYGLQREHQQVVLAIYDIRKLLNETMIERETRNQQSPVKSASQGSGANGLASHDNGNVNSRVQTMAEQCSMHVAGQTSDYVNSVLEKVVSGCIDGGLQT